MDERTTRLLEITKAVDRAMGPMKPVLERTTRLLEITKAVDRAMGPMKPVLERTPRLLEITQAIERVLEPMKPALECVKPLNEFRNSLAALSSVPLATDWKPLRAPGIQTRAHPEPVPALRSPTAPEKPSQEVKIGHVKKKRVREPSLMSEAIEKARKATKSEQAGILWTWIAKNAADCFMDYDEVKDQFSWKGKQIPTKYEAFKRQVNRLSKKATRQDI